MRSGSRRNLFAILTEGPVVVSKKRLEALKEVNDLASSLANEERELRAGMRPEVSKVTSGKAICLFRRLLEQTGFPDMGVVDALVSGVHLVGMSPPPPSSLSAISQLPSHLINSLRRAPLGVKL